MKIGDYAYYSRSSYFIPGITLSTIGILSPSKKKKERKTQKNCEGKTSDSYFTNERTDAVHV